ncbi:MAG: PAS domain S-box protein [Ignavibacteriales bacterium]|nr:MAG: PAS domain S-box protein [Ignavibacteriales bacterium]
MTEEIRVQNTTARILLIDDNIQNISSIENALVNSSYKLIVLKSLSDDLIEILKNDLPDLFLLNQSLLDKGCGIKLFKFIHNEVNVPRIIICDSKHFSERNHSHSDYDFITLPVEPVKLLVSIEVKLYKSRLMKHIQESESRSFALFNGNHAVMLLVDPETGGIHEANKAAEKFYGYSAAQFKSMNISQINVKSRPEIMHIIQKIISGEKNRFYFKHRLASGSVKDVEVFSSPVLFNGRTLLYSIIHDITERRKSEEALAKRDERYKALIQTTGNGFLSMLSNGRIVEANDSACQMLGFEKEELFTKYINDIDANESPQQTQQHIEAVIAEGWDRFETRLRRKNGEIFSVQINVVYINSQGVFLCFVTDISNQKNSEELIRKSEQRLRTVTENVDAIMFSIDCSGIVTMADGKPLRDLGFEPGDIIGKNVFTDFKNIRNISENLTKSLRGIETRDVITIRDLFFKWSAKPQHNLHGEIVGVIGIMSDITNRVKQEHHIKKLSQAVEQSQVSIVITDVQGNIEYVNSKFTSVTGYSFDEAKGQNPRILKSGDQPEEFYKMLWDTITSGKEWTGTFRNKKKNGDLFWEYANISPIVNEAGKITNFVAVKEDITARIEAEDELKKYQLKLEELVEERTGQIKKQNNFFKTLLDTIPNPIFVKNTDGEYTEVNKAFEEFFGIERNYIIGKTVDDVPGGEPAVLAKKYDCELYASHKKVVYETSVVNKEGQQKTLLVYKASFGQGGNTPEGITGLLIDITRQKEYELHTKAALEKEKELNEMKTNFISMTSHEFRTPLTSILSSADLLEMYIEKWTKEKSTGHLKKIQNSVLYMTDMLDKVLTMSRSERGLFTFIPQKFNLQSLVRDIVEESQSQFVTHKINFENQCSAKNVFADPKLISHILNNLISNAIKYSTKNNEINLTAVSDGDKIEFIVSDKGIGIPSDELKMLFEPFFRGRNSGTIKGSGLGLSIVKKAVELHNGSISVDSAFGKGSTFKVRLSCEKNTDIIIPVDNN